MFAHTLFLEPLAQATDRNACRLTYAGVLVPETRLDEWPNLTHQRCHVLAASLNGNTQGKDSTTTAGGVDRVEVLADQLAQRREDLRWRQVGGKTINDPQGRLSCGAFST